MQAETALLCSAAGCRIVSVLRRLSPSAWWNSRIKAVHKNQNANQNTSKHQSKHIPAASVASASDSLQTALSKVTRRIGPVCARSVSRRVTSDRDLTFFNGYRKASTIRILVASDLLDQRLHPTGHHHHNVASRPLKAPPSLDRNLPREKWLPFRQVRHVFRQVPGTPKAAVRNNGSISTTPAHMGSRVAISRGD